MDDYNPGMPSEDEDFDAVIAPPARRKPRTPRKPKVEAETEAKDVTPASVAQESTPVSISVPQPRFEPEAETPEQGSQPEPEPEAVPEEPAYEVPQTPEVPAPAENRPLPPLPHLQPRLQPVRQQAQPSAVANPVAIQTDKSEPAQPLASQQVPTTPLSAAPSTPEFVEPFGRNKIEVQQADEPDPQDPEVVADQTPQASPAANLNSPSQAVRLPKLPVRLSVELLLLVAVLGLGLWTWKLSADRQDLRTQVASLKANPEVALQQQTDQLIQAVGSLMTLPANETPTVANVSDVSAARKQSAFFNNAQNGDKVLMYVKAGEAILYRPSTNKIVLVAPLTFNNTAAGAAPNSASKTP